MQSETLFKNLKKLSAPLARFSLFIVFFWFGTLKIFGESPANPLVENLLSRTMPGITFENFIIFLGIWEMAIGVLFIIPKMEKLAIILLIPHMITTFMPLVFLTEITWQSTFTPTLEGQYIIKNLVVIALAINLFISTKTKR